MSRLVKLVLAATFLAALMCVSMVPVQAFAELAVGLTNVQDGVHIYTNGLGHTGPTGPLAPSGVRYGPDYMLYANNRSGPAEVDVRLSDGSWDVYATGLVGHVQSFKFGPDGNLYVCSYYNLIHRFYGPASPNAGNPMPDIGLGLGVYADTGKGTYPEDIAFEADGSLLFAWGGGPKVSRISPGGGPAATIITVIDEAGLTPRGIEVMSDGVIWVADQANGNLYRYTSAGVRIDQLDTLASSSYGLSSVCDGYIYSSGLGNTVGKPQVARYNASTGVRDYAWGPLLVANNGYAQDVDVLCPEPGSLMALLIGVSGLGGLLKLRRK